MTAKQQQESDAMLRYLHECARVQAALTIAARQALLSTPENRLKAEHRLRLSLEELEWI